MYRDWTVVKLFAVVFGAIWALAGLPLFWGAWTPFVGAGGAFAMAMIISVLMTMLDLT